MMSNMWRIVFLCAVVTIAQVAATFGPPSHHCTGDFVIFRNKEYRLFNEKANFDEAQINCEIWGAQWGSPTTANLTTIRDHSMQECLVRMIQRPGNYKPEDWTGEGPFSPGYYIGGSDENNEGQWMWKGGELVPGKGSITGYENWAQLEPNNAGAAQGEDCLSVMMTGFPGFFDYNPGKWIDHRWDHRQFFICERDIADELLWGFDHNPHSVTPERWSLVSPECSSPLRQSPVDIDIEARSCPVSQQSLLVGWSSDERHMTWRIRNTGRLVEIKPFPAQSVFATFTGSNVRHFVDKIHLKWGSNPSSGSDHVVGGIRYAGELQVYHLPVEGTRERIATSFMIQQRSFVDNRKWNGLLHHIGLVTQFGRRSNMAASQLQLTELLNDSVAERVRYVTAAAIRYRGSMPMPPCTEDVTWIVHPRAIPLSTLQMQLLRSVKMEANLPMSDNNRPLQTNNQPHCLIL